jgi:hypothetical protein
MYYKTPQACRMLGRTYNQIMTAIRHGHIEPPPKDSSGDYIWTDETIESVRQVLDARPRWQRRGAAEEIVRA